MSGVGFAISKAEAVMWRKFHTLIVKAQAPLKGRLDLLYQVDLDDPDAREARYRVDQALVWLKKEQEVLADIEAVAAGFQAMIDRYENAAVHKAGPPALLPSDLELTQFPGLDSLVTTGMDAIAQAHREMEAEEDAEAEMLEAGRQFDSVEDAISALADDVLAPTLAAEPLGPALAVDEEGPSVGEMARRYQLIGEAVDLLEEPNPEPALPFDVTHYGVEFEMVIRYRRRCSRTLLVRLAEDLAAAEIMVFDGMEAVVSCKALSMRPNLPLADPD